MVSSATDAFTNVNCNSPIPLNHRWHNAQSPRHRYFVGSREPRRIGTVPPEGFYDLLIIGGGIHGFGTLLHAINCLGPKARVLMVNSSEYACQDFLDRIDASGQTVLRSPYEHQLAPDGTTQMLDFAQLHYAMLRSVEQDQVQLAKSSVRSIVPMDVFEGHLNHLAELNRVTARSFRAVVTETSETSEGYMLRLGGNRIEARNLILATGALPRTEDSMRTDISSLEGNDEIVVDGGGLSAAEAILRNVDRFDRITWRTHLPIRLQCSDVPHKYFRTEGIASFQRRAQDARRAGIRDATRSSIMPEYKAPLLQLLKSGRLRLVEATDEMGHVPADRCVRPSAGYTARATHMELFGEEAGVKGFQDDTLELNGHRGVFATGWLAMESIGPAAKNIDGVRLCAQRFLPEIVSRIIDSPTTALFAASPGATGSAPIGTEPR